MKFLLSFCVSILFAASVHAETSPRVGVILPLTGGLASLGEKVRRGITLAAEREGIPLSHFIFEDGEFSNTKAVGAFQKLSSADHVGAIIGPFGPGQTEAIAGLAKARGIPVIAVALCDKKFRDLPGALCTYISPREQAAPAIERFKKPDIAAKAGRVAVLIEDVEGFQEYRGMAEEYGREGGRTLVASETFSGDATDFKATFLKFKSQNVSFFLFGAVDPHKTATALRQARQVGFRPEVQWVVTELDQNVFEENRDVFDNSWYLSMAIISDDFKHTFTARYKLEPDLYSAIGFDATRSLLTALQTAGPREGDMLEKLYRQRLSGTAFRGFYFDRVRGVAIESKLARIEKGKVVYVEE